MTLHQMLYNQTLADRSLSSFRGSAQDSQPYWEIILKNSKSKAKEGGGGEGDESELVSVACTANCRIRRPISLLMIGESSQLDSLRIEYAYTPIVLVTCVLQYCIDVTSSRDGVFSSSLQQTELNQVRK